MSHQYFQVLQSPNPKPAPGPEHKSPRLIVIIITAVAVVLIAASFLSYWVLRKPLPTPPILAVEQLQSLSGTVKKISANELTIRVPNTTVVGGETFINYEDKKILISAATEVVRLKIGADKQISFTPAQMQDIIFNIKVIVSATQSGPNEFRATKIIIGG